MILRKLLILSFILTVSSAFGQNNALSLSSSSSQYVSIPHSASLNITSDFTWEAWVYWQGGQNIFIKGSYGYGTYVNGEMEWWQQFTQGAGPNSSGLGLTQNTWTHLAITVENNSTLKFYKNGNLVTTTTGNLVNNTGPLIIGAQGTCYCNYFNGLLDEFRIWNVTRTQAEIQASMNTSLSAQTGLVAYYTFDAATGVQDQSGNGNHGTLTNGAGYASSGVTVTSACAVVDQALTAADASVCAGSGTTIATASSETGVNYSLYEATGNTVVDGPTAGTGSALTLNTGNLSAATDFYLIGSQPDTLSSIAGGALHFDRTNDYVNCGNLVFGNSFTYEGWVYIDNLNSDQVLFGRYNAFLWWNTSRIRFEMRNSSNTGWLGNTQNGRL